MTQPAILPEDATSRARRAFLRFQHALDSLEQELKPLEIDPDLKLLLGRMSATCRTFFTRANDELFSAVHSTQKEVGIRGK